MIVVSDTTPLNYLVLIETIGVLPALFDEVYVPPSFIDELIRPATPSVVRRWVEAPPPAWLKIIAPVARLASTATLGNGEADALSLAKELQIAEVLIDERRGTNIARREGLFPVPTLAVLERAAADGLIELPSALDRLQQTNFRVPINLIQAALERDRIRKLSS